MIVVSAFHQRNGFALKASHLAVGQDRLQSIANFDSRTVILNGVENQDAAIGGLCADAPLVEEIDRVTFDVGAVERIDGDERDLGVGFVVDLMAEVFDLTFCALVEHSGEIVDVAGGLEIFDRLGPRGDSQGHDE